MGEESPDIRWKQRFHNFSRAFNLLREIVEAHDDLTTLEAIVKEGIIQRFEYTFELAWKTLKDLMQEDGLEIEVISPKFVFKLAYQSKYIDTIDPWLKMTGDRNLMSHTYNFKTFDKILRSLKNEYFQIIESLYSSFLDRMMSDE
jgi:nucleotidyltransferase substrate binding protein (TIGR01987 family)